VGVLAAGLFVFLLQVSAQDTVPTLQDTMKFHRKCLEQPWNYFMDWDDPWCVRGFLHNQ